MAEYQIMVQFNDTTGSLGLSYPQGKKLIALGMLEVAKEAILDNERALANKVQPVTSLPSHLTLKPGGKN